MNTRKKKNAAVFADPNALPTGGCPTLADVIKADFDALVSPRFPNECADVEDRKLLLTVWIMAHRQCSARFATSMLAPLDAATMAELDFLNPPPAVA